jgi:hypothetical protein
MRINSFSATKTLFVVCAGLVLGSSVYAVSEDGYESVSLTSRKLNGPRLGMSYILGSELPKVNGKEVGPLISQFGWHFEWLVKPEGGGPAFVTQFIPFLGGVEHSILIPSMSLVLGIRMPFGFEFGMGPHITTHFTKDEAINPSLIVAIGQSINFSGVSIPLNLAVTTSKKGQALAFVFGYALPSRRD